MVLKVLFVLTLFSHAIFGQNYHCSRRSATLLLKRPTYEFSVKILQRVAQETDGHFVFSPLSTWLQLLALAEGAKGRTLREIWHITRHHRNRCFKRKLSAILYQMNSDLKYESKRRSIMIIDHLMGVKNSYIREVRRLYGMKVLLLDFNDPVRSAAKVNKIIHSSTNGKIAQSVYYDDFINTVLLMSDVSYFKTVWKSPFKPVNTRMEPFYSSFGKKLEDIYMMQQINYFNITEFPLIDAKVLELPFADGRFSMLVFLPLRGNLWTGDILYSLESTRLTSIFNMFKYEGIKLVNVKLPRFNINTMIENIPELVYDMGIKKIFDPNLAEFGPISDFNLHASLMTQISDIEVTEKGVRARETAGFPVSDNNTVNFVANRPFAFMIVDRSTEFILYAGIYSVPSAY